MNINELNEQQLKEWREHRDVLTNIQFLLGVQQGRGFIKYLFKSLDAGGLPERGLEGQDLFERIGVLRAGQSIYKLVAEASPAKAGEILGEIEKEANDEAFEAVTT